MKIIKKLNPIQESISKVGETKKSLKEEIDKNYKIGRVLDPAAADAVDLHREFRKQGLERQANPDKDPLVKEFIDETASAKSRTKHIDVVDRKELAKVLTEAKKKKQKFKVGKSDKLGYRYFVDIFPVYGSQGALDVVEDDDTEVEVAETDSGEMLSESMNKPLSFEEAKKLIKDKFGTDLNKETYDAILKLGGSKNTKNNLKEDIESDIKSYISWCKKNNREAKDYNSLKDFMSNKKNLKESYSSDKEEDVLELARALGTAHDGLIEAQDLLDDLVGREIISSDLYDEIMDLESDVSKYDFMGEDDPVQVLLDKYGYNDDLNESLKEAKYKIPMNDSEDYINAMYKAYKALKNRKSGYAAVYGYRKDKKFIPLLSIKDSQAELTKVVDGLKTREKGQTDTIVYTLFKNNLDGAEDTLKSKGLLKENLQDYDPDEEFAAELVKAGATVDDLKAGKWPEKLEHSYDYYAVSPYSKDNALDIPEDEEEDLFQDTLEKALEIADKYKANPEVTAIYIQGVYEDDFGEADEIVREWHRDKLNEDLQVYTSTLKDFKPAKEAEPLWNEIIENDKLDLLETSLENVFKAEGEDNASIDIEGLNDLLINHPDFIRTLLSLNDSYIADEDEYDEEPIYTSNVVDDEEDPYYGDEVENVEDETDEVVVDDMEDNIEELEDDEDVEPIEDGEEIEDKNEKETVKEDFSSSLKLNKTLNESTDVEEETTVKEDVAKEDEEDALDEALANGMIKYLKENAQETLQEKADTSEKERLYKEYTDKLIEETSKEDDEDDVVAISDDEVNEMMGLPSEKEVLQKQQEAKKLEEAPEKKPYEEKIEECKDGKAQ